MRAVEIILSLCILSSAQLLYGNHHLLKSFPAEDTHSAAQKVQE